MSVKCQREREVKHREGERKMEGKGLIQILRLARYTFDALFL